MTALQTVTLAALVVIGVVVILWTIYLIIADDGDANG